VLLHGQGFSRRCWAPIVDMLAAERDVIAVDLPGHGDSPRQPKGTGSAPHDLAVAVAELLDEFGLPSVHVAGNSSGGWVALELGRLQRAQQLVDVGFDLPLRPGEQLVQPVHRRSVSLLAGRVTRPSASCPR
jgi:pimeloyl-ACP methyl ester carboxylesterase